MTFPVNLGIVVACPRQEGRVVFVTGGSFVVSFSAYRTYKGFRLYLPEDADFRRDVQGRYIVHVLIARLDAEMPERIRVSNCYAWDLREAQELSIQQAMSMIDTGLVPKQPE